MKISVDDSGLGTYGNRAASNLATSAFKAALLVRDRLGIIAEDIEVIKIRFVRESISPCDDRTEIRFSVIAPHLLLGLKCETASLGTTSIVGMAKNLLDQLIEMIRTHLSVQSTKTDRISDHLNNIGHDF